MAIKKIEQLLEMIVGKMRSQAESAGVERAQVDISGGVDSAVVVAIAVRTFGKDKVVGVYSSINSSEASHRRAKLVAAAFGFPLVVLDLTEVYEKIVLAVRHEFTRLDLPFPDPEDPQQRTGFGGLRSCIRAPVGRFVNRVFGGGIRQGTGNRDEDQLIRFYQKGGDGEVDNNWLGGLFKSEIWELATHLGVPEEIVNATPTPDLWGKGDEHTDEGELEQISGVALTYTRPGGPMGSIEWGSRQNDDNGCITGDNVNTPPAELGYDVTQCKVIEALRRWERITRHKAELPPHLPRTELLQAGVVD